MRKIDPDVDKDTADYGAMKIISTFRFSSGVVVQAASGKVYGKDRGRVGDIAKNIKFGNNSNQTHHVFRHTDKLKINRSILQDKIKTHFAKVADKIIEGKPFNQIIEVNGKQIQYTAYKLKDGTINIGRIHGVS